MIGLYILIVFSLSGDVLHEDSRLMTFDECRVKRSYEILWYQLERDQEVQPVCIRAEDQ